MRGIAVILTLFLLTVSFLWYQCLHKKHVKVQVEIERGTSVRKTMKILEKKGVIRNALVGEIVARILGFPVKEGCYAFDGDYNLIEVLKVLSNGSPCMVSFTILPGYDIFDVDRVLSEKGICKEGEVSKHKELEGFLLPDTYKVAKGISCELAISVMRENFDKKVLPLFENYEPPPLVKRGLGNVTLKKIVTVASIVEKETSLKEEKKLIAGIIYNRLIKGMKLQCDPTVYYALKLSGIFKKRISVSDTLFRSEYNTYYVYGLPPSPICNPSVETIKSAMYPQETEYLYFVACNRRHLFSKTYKGHLRNIIRSRRCGKSM